MRHFSAPLMEIQRLVPEDLFTKSCTIESLGCASCYCAAVDCEGTYTGGCGEYDCNNCYGNTDW